MFVLVTLIAISSLRQHAVAACGSYLALILLLAAATGLPLAGLLKAAATVLPFAFSFALITWFAGQGERAMLLVTRSYVSAAAALLLVGTTPMPALIGGLETLRAPKFLLLVMQFLYRYLVVLFEEAGAIRDAGASRGGSLRSLQLRQAGAAAGVLFARAYQRANAIHQAMVARGFEGTIRSLSPPVFRWQDGLFMTLFCGVSVALRVAFQ